MEDKPPPARYELGNINEKNMIQRDDYSSDLCTLLQNNNFSVTLEGILDINKNPNTTFIIEESYEPSSIASGKAELKNHEEKCKILQGICSEGEGEVSHEHKEKYVPSMEDINKSLLMRIVQEKRRVSVHLTLPPVL